MPVKYQQGKIYKIVCNITKEVYIGSTTELTLARRLANHNKDCKNWLNDPEKYHYISSFQILTRGNYQIVLLESCPCNNKDELRMKEREWFDKIKNINTNRPFTSVEEKKDQKKEYNKEHKEEIKIQRKEHYEEHKKEISEKHKIYREVHKKEINEYYQNHKEEIIKKAKERFTCECGSICRISDKTKHFKTQKHLEYLSNVNIDVLE